MSYFKHLCLCVLCAASAFTAEAVRYTSELPVKLGEWNTNFAEAKALADEQNIPLVCFWGGSSCSVCKTVEGALEAAEVEAWQSERKFVMCFQSGTSGEMKEFVRNASGIIPYFCVYWNRGDGMVTTNRFSGVVVGTSRWPATGTTTAEHFINSVELYAGDYKPAPYYSGSFACGDTVADRLEAVLGETKTLYVPLKRDRASSHFAATNSVVATYPKGTYLASTTNAVEWTEEELERLVPVILPEDTSRLRETDVIRLDLLNAVGNIVETRSAVYVAKPANGPADPDWIGEPFEFGRLTFDYDAATNAVARKLEEGKKAYTLAFFTGALWCPYCRGMETSLMAPGSAFYEWARENNVALVEFDQGVASSPATAAGTRSPRLLTYDAYGPDEGRGILQSTSGAGYLSRHEVMREAAEMELSRITHYTSVWRAPEATAARLSQPTFLLIKDDQVVARFTAWRDSDRNYDIKENLGRLDDFLKLAEGPGEASAYRTTTPLTTMVGQTEETKLQISNRTAFYRLSGLAAGDFMVTRTDTNPEPVVFALFDGAQQVCVGTNSLTCALTRARLRDSAAADFTLRVTAYGNTSVRLFNPADGTAPRATSVFTAGFKTAMTLSPEEGAVSFVPAETQVAVRVESGKNYRFAGFSDASLRQAFDPAEGGLWTARADGVVDLTVAQPGEQVTYQQWNPGELAFLDTAEFVLSEKVGTVYLDIVRLGGVSGVQTAEVSVVGGTANANRYELAEVPLVWEDGEAMTNALALTVIDDYVHDGDQYFDLQIGSSVKRIVLLEDDATGPGRLAITATRPAVVRNDMVYAVSETPIEIEISRLEGADGEVGAIVSATVDGVDRSDLLDVQQITWGDKSRGAEAVKTVTLATDGLKPGASVSFKMRATGGVRTDPARKTLTVRILSDEAPEFEVPEVAFAGLERVAVSCSNAVVKVQGGAVSVRKLSGSLPNGVKAAYDAEIGCLMFSGIATRAGTYSAVYQVSEKRADGTVAGGTMRVSMTIESLAGAFPLFAGTSSSSVASRTFKDIYFIEGENKLVTGLMTLTIPSSGKLSAKYVSPAGTAVFSTTGWSAWDAESGTLTALLTCRSTAFPDYWMNVVVQTSGEVLVQLHDATYPTVYLERRLNGRMNWSSMANANDWRGVYTIAMPVNKYVPVSDYDVAYAAAAAGAPTFSVRMVSKNAINAGRFTWAGFLPNGKGISGSAVVNRTGTRVELPIFHRSATESFSALQVIEGGVADLYAEDGGGAFKFGLRAITAHPQVVNRWTHDDNRTGVISFSWTYGAYGSYFAAGENLEEALLLSGVASDVVFTVDPTVFPESVNYGPAQDVVRVGVDVVGEAMASTDNTALRLSLNRSTGVLSGTVKLPYANQTVQATYRGVVLPGWTGCGCHDEDIDLPLAFGACWFTDKVYATDPSTHVTKSYSVRRGMTVSCETHIAE